MTLRSLLALFPLLLEAGCMCGAAAVATSPDAGDAYVNGAATVVFDSTAPGTTETFSIPIHDTADMNETLLSASFSGPDAASFQVLSADFPIAMPAGTTVHVQVSFTPNRLGTFSAELMVQTADMGISPITVTGIGGAADGG